LKRTYCQPGFTLIELLVVIAIITVLAATLFPVFATAKESGRRAQCITNLKELGLAVRAYADDWDGRLPTVRVGDESARTHGDWCGVDVVGGPCNPEQGQIYNYVKTRGIFLCPSDRNKPAARCGALDEAAQRRYPLSYSMNVVLSWRNLDTMARPEAVGTGKNHQLSKILLLIHEDRTTINDGDFNWAGTDIPENVHAGGTTILYCDLHAKWQSANAIVTAIKRGEYNPDTAISY
jgi:prepilin-type N-terminal cleavage/methylation domain-containing protein/prepilin-type processing-associated H-X9-DG protein